MKLTLKLNFKTSKSEKLKIYKFGWITEAKASVSSRDKGFSIVFDQSRKKKVDQFLIKVSDQSRNESWQRKVVKTVDKKK